MERHATPHRSSDAYQGRMRGASSATRSVAWALVFGLALGWSRTTPSAPPEYQTFKRAQSLDPQPAIVAQDLMRIWMIHIGQGDAILIQLPARYASTVNGRTELVDVLVDGGPTGQQLNVFLSALYPDGARIEHVVLTHHDSDHVKGLTALLKDDRFAVQNVYHNGIASWAPGKKGFPVSGSPSTNNPIFDGKRGMAFLESDGSFKREYIMKNLTEVATALSAAELAGVYQDFASAISLKKKPAPVAAFERVYTNSNFIGARQKTPPLPASIRFEPLWPREALRQYKNWGFSINGNSATFRLAYGDFSMLFTGDHNDASGADLMEVFKAGGDVKRLRSEVMKVPHHGSRHNSKEFFGAVAPVVSVASMGSQGFGNNWKHPSEEIVSWLGGPHRVYHTYIHERAVDYSNLTEAKRNAMIEKKHILIETDGRWFRVVECEDPRSIPLLQGVKRGDGTRWIRAGG